MRIAVLRGGPSSDYETSLITGAHAVKHLKQVHTVEDIFVDKEGTWHRRGVPIEPHRLAPHIDVFVNALHGEYGEDGRVQQILEPLQVQYTGPRFMSAVNSWRKDIARELLIRAGLRVPEGRSVSTLSEPYEVADIIHRELGGQYVVKPISGSASKGVEIVRAFPDLGQALVRALMKYKRVLVEELLRGIEIKCVVVNNFRNQDFYAFLPIEIARSQLEIYSPTSEHYLFSPARLSASEKKLAMQTAIHAHKALHMHDYSSVDMMFTKRGPYVLEVDALPPMGNETIFNKSLESVGATCPEFLKHIVSIT